MHPIIIGFWIIVVMMFVRYEVSRVLRTLDRIAGALEQWNAPMDQEAARLHRASQKLQDTIHTSQE